MFQDVFSGMALRPSWGAMYGDEAVSEQALAEQALEGCRQMRWCWATATLGSSPSPMRCQQSRRPMVLRLTKARAQKVLGESWWRARSKGSVASESMGP